MNTTFTNANILIVDDKRANIVILEDFLEMQGYKNILSTTDPRVVVDIYSSFKPDLILLDLMMPHMSGFEVMAKLKKLIPKNSYIPILVLTADATREAKQQALSEGANDFLSKPFELVEVALRIRNLLFTRRLYQQVQTQNQILEEEVKKRTLELELTNRDLIVAKDKAEASDRLKTAFLNNISHEIRTPLNGILGSSFVIIQPDTSQEEKELYVNILNTSSERLLNTITDYIDISQIVSGSMGFKIKSVDYFSIMQKLHTDFDEHCADKKLELRLDHPQRTLNPILLTDEDLLIKALSHLLNNAIKFTSAGSITIGYSLKEAAIDFFVKDTGIGITQDAQNHIFKIFSQEDYLNTRGYEGSGLGLSISSGIVRLLGGSLSLESEKLEGTTVSITLPYQQIIA